MKATRTKYLPFTNTKPSRIIAKAEGVPSLTLTCNALDEWRVENKLEHITNHQAAARLLAVKYGWSTTFVSGGLPDGTWAHCFVPESVGKALKGAQSVVSGEVAIRADGELGKPYLQDLLSHVNNSIAFLNL